MPLRLWGPLGPPPYLFLVISLLPVCMRGSPDSRAPPVGPTEEAEPYVADSRWGRAVRQRWEDGSFSSYLKEEVEKVNDFGFWVDVFKSCLPEKPARERRRQERSARRKHERNRGDREREKERNLNRRQRPGPKFAAYDEWLQAYQEDPFKGLQQLPLQSSRPEDSREEREAILLQQLEEENAFGAFRLRFQHLRTLAVGARKRVFTGEAPGAHVGVPPGASSQQGGGPSSSQWGGAPAGRPLEGFPLPELNATALRLQWWDIAKTQYLPAIPDGVHEKESGRQFMEDLHEAFEGLERELLLRTASEAHQRLLMQQSSAAGAATAAAAAAAAAATTGANGLG